MLITILKIGNPEICSIYLKVLLYGLLGGKTFILRIFWTGKTVLALYNFMFIHSASCQKEE